MRNELLNKDVSVLKRVLMSTTKDQKIKYLKKLIIVTKSISDSKIYSNDLRFQATNLGNLARKELSKL